MCYTIIMAKRRYMKRNLSQNPLYRVWVNMRWRCYGKSNRQHRYVERGIRVCERWQDFANFREDMLKGYEENLTIERKDNDGNYEPNNCRWATRKEQANNRCSNRKLEYDGKRLTVAQWSDKANCKPSTFRQRLYVYKWSLEKALS